jgi:serine protease
MKATLLFASLLILSVTSLWAQSRERFRVENDDYHPNVIWVKLSAQSNGMETNRSSSFSWIKGTKNLFNTPKNSHSNRRSKNVIDVSLYRQLELTDGADVEEAINSLLDAGIIEYGQPVYRVYPAHEPNDPENSIRYQYEQVMAFEAWDLTKGNSNVVIAIVDSGLDMNHPDLVNKLAINEDEIPDNGIDDDNDGYIDNYRGWDFSGSDESNIEEDNDPSITKGGGHNHGTFVAGLAAAETDNGIGISGIGYNSSILVTKHYSDNQDEEDRFYSTSPYLGVVYAVEQGVDVINCSWGGGAYGQVFQDIMTWATIDNDIVVVAAAGNENSEEPHYPSSYDNVLSVASVTRDMSKSGFSNFGYTVDVSAPGSSVKSTSFNDDYSISSGTSFASPIAAGAAALLRDYRPDLTAVEVLEVLRLSANPEVYEVNEPQFKDKLGNGVLDIHNALDYRSPAIRIQNLVLLNDDGNAAKPGDETNLIVNFKNSLFASTQALSMRVSSLDPTVQIVGSDFVVIGGIGSNELSNNSKYPIRVKLESDIPPDSEVTFKFEFVDVGYSDYQYYSTTINETLIDITTNSISTSIASIGRAGYKSDGPGAGLGFVYNEEQLLYEMGFIVAVSTEKLSNSIRAQGNTFDKDFAQTSDISAALPGEGDRAYTQVSGSFDDSNSDTPLIIEVQYHALANREAKDANYVILEYTIENKSDEVIQDFYAGLFADWDINTETGGDEALWDEISNMGYVRSGDVNLHLPLAGIQILSGEPNYYAIDNDQDIDGNPWGLYDGFTDEEKFESISSGLDSKIEAGTAEGGGDVSHMVASGPYSLSPNESVKVAFALHGGLDMDQLRESAEAAKKMYNQTLPATKPKTDSIMVCYGTSTVLTASAGTNYQWYTEKYGGLPFQTGNSLTTGDLSSDTIFYVSDMVEDVESLREPFVVTVAGNPTIEISQNQPIICPGDTIVLSGKADNSYLWQLPSNATKTSREIKAIEEGWYYLLVNSSVLTCESAIDSIEVRKKRGPLATYSISNDTSYFCRDTIVSFIFSGSDDAKLKLWNVAGRTFEGNEVAYPMESEGAFSAELFVVNEEGCTDLDTGSFYMVNNTPSSDYSFEQGRIPGSRSIPVQFTDESQFASNWIWDFGDGSTSTEEDPQHTYEGGGLYNVTLAIENAIGCKDTVIKVLSISVVTDVGEEIHEMQVSLYPNPVSSSLSVVVPKELVGEKTIEFLDLNGKVLYQEQFNSTGEVVFDLERMGHSKMILVRLFTEKLSITKKLLLD